MTRPRIRVTAVALAGCLLGLALSVRFGAPFAFSIALALPSTEGWLASVAQREARQEVIIAVHGRRLHADLYRPARPRSALLLVHGLSRAGRRQPQLVRLARLLARQGRLVLVPEFVGLAAFRLSGREVEETRSALRYLTGLSDSVGVAGFSFGAGPALLAAAELTGLRVVGSFGGYAHLGDVIAYITTGVHSFGGRRYVHRVEEYNRWKLLAVLVGFVETGRDRRLLAAIAAGRLEDPSAPTTALERDLGDEGRHVMALVLNRREAAVASLLAALPPRAREALDRLSPLAVIPRLSGRLLIAHGADDDSIAFTESLRLAEAARGRARVAILQTFHHTGPEPFWPSLRLRAVDGWNLFRLVDDLLAQ